MRRTVFIGVLVIATQAAAYPGTPQQYVECLRLNAHRADDGISDAATIASVIVPECRAQRLKLFEDRAPDSIMVDVLRNPATRDDLILGVRIVLKERAAKR